MSVSLSLLSIMDRYRKFLDASYPEHIGPFNDRLSAQPASARAEALGYFFFSEHTDKVDVAEDRAKGGIDFLCRTQKTEYVVEVTHLEVETVRRRSGLPNEPPRHTGEGRFYKMITASLRNTVRNKVKQMSGYNCPRLLLIACEHVHANSVMDTRAAELLLTYDCNFPQSEVFYYEKCKKWQALYQSISAILLVSVSFDHASVLGVLHPVPHYKFPIELLAEVPFVGLGTFPPEQGILDIDWYQQQPHGFGYQFRYDSV